jgi:hypothetical protein
MIYLTSHFLLVLLRKIVPINETLAPLPLITIGKFNIYTYIHSILIPFILVMLVEEVEEEEGIDCRGSRGKCNLLSRRRQRRRR